MANQMINSKQQMNPGYSIYMPPHMAQLQPNQMQQHLNPQLSKSTGNSNPNRMGGYIQQAPPTFMMNQPQYFNSNMMGYGMPMRNDNLSSNDKSKERQPYQMYYPSNNWNHMMMNPHTIIRPEGGSSGQSGNITQQPPVNYQMMPPPPSNSDNNGSSQNVRTNMHSGMGMYMPPYSMDPRYQPYMGYPPYIGKKNEEPPRDPR